MILKTSPVTLFRIHVDLPTRRAFRAASSRAVAPCCFSDATVVPGLPAFRASAVGAYQMGELQARSCTVDGTTLGGGIFSSAAWMVVQRGVGISRTRA